MRVIMMPSWHAKAQCDVPFCLCAALCGAVCCSAAVGAWSGKLYGLVQDLTLGDGAVDGLALGYADEQKQTDANGNLQKLTWQFQVKIT